MYGGRYDEIIAGLTEAERITLFCISRIKKSDTERVFYIGQVRLPKKNKDINVLEVLLSVECKKIVTRADASKKKWKVTHDGKEIEHVVAIEEKKKKYPGMSIFPPR